MSDESKKFQFSFTCEVTLSQEEIWPDGGGPENPTLEDVVSAIKEYSSEPRYLLSDWELDRDMVLIVSDPTEGRGQRVE